MSYKFFIKRSMAPPKGGGGGNFPQMPHPISTIDITHFLMTIQLDTYYFNTMSL